MLVGRGRMGGTLAAAWRAAGISFVHVSGRRAAQGKGPRAARGEGPTLWVLAVTDAAVAPVCAALVSGRRIVRGDGVVHLAGMLGPEALETARAIGARVGAMHPLVAVADPRRPPSLRGSAASYEGHAGLAAWLRQAMAPTGMAVHRLRAVDRAMYHAAAALCATGAIALAQGAAALFPRSARVGADDAAVRAFVRSLLASAAHNVFAVGPEKALASPLLRGDAGAVEKHLESMRAAPLARAVYAAGLLQVIDTLARQEAVEPRVLSRARTSARRALAPRSRG